MRLGGARGGRRPAWPVDACSAMIGPWIGSGAWWRCPGGPARGRS